MKTINRFKSNNPTKRVFEGYDKDINDDNLEEFPNYGSESELYNTVKRSFEQCMLSEDSYDDENDRFSDLGRLSQMNNTLMKNKNDVSKLDSDQLEMVYMIVYNSHINPTDLTDTELLAVVNYISGFAYDEVDRLI